MPHTEIRLLLKKSLVQLEPLPKGEPKTSSVLIPLGWNENTEQHEILLTKRTELVHTHKGQVNCGASLITINTSFKTKTMRITY
jgi:hypothetical protein